MRVDRPHAPYYRYTGKGVLTAKPAAAAPTTAVGRLGAAVRRVLIGRPLASDQETEERLSKKKALAIFSSDAISSSAYATEEILRVLFVAGAVAFTISLEVAVAIAIMLAIVSTSYRQICYAYPSGGGAYAVGRENLGKLPALVAAGALLVDYILTVAVSTSSAVQQIVSALPDLAPWGVIMGVAFILLMTLGNLRGIRESGNIFALPTYLFVGVTLVMIAVGVFRIAVLGEGVEVANPLPGAPDVLEPLTLLLVLRAFASGSVALTGVEAIANGVPAFRRPEPRNAAATLSVMALLLGVLFVGITFLADGFGILPNDEQTVVAQVAGTVFGADSLGFYVFQTFTRSSHHGRQHLLTAFKRLAAILARTTGASSIRVPGRPSRKPWHPHPERRRILAAGVLPGDTHAIIPLYSVGVLVSFTISQSGMVVHCCAIGARLRWALSITRSARS